MERYLDAARKIARLAVGDPEMPVMVNIHRLDDEQSQDARAEDLPFGTRGGLAIHSYFPVDADYTIKVELACAAARPAGAGDHGGRRARGAVAARGKCRGKRRPRRTGRRSVALWNSGCR